MVDTLADIKPSFKDDTEIVPTPPRQSAFSNCEKVVERDVKVSKVSIDLGKGAVNALVLSNNRIQLKFRTKDFVGEYFYYDRDLFLIYRSGHLARLTCKPT